MSTTKRTHDTHDKPSHTATIRWILPNTPQTQPHAEVTLISSVTPAHTLTGATDSLFFVAPISAAVEVAVDYSRDGLDFSAQLLEKGTALIFEQTA